MGDGFGVAALGGELSAWARAVPRQHQAISRARKRRAARQRAAGRYFNVASSRRACPTQPASDIHTARWTSFGRSAGTTCITIGNRQRTAEMLDINRTTLFNKMKKYGLMNVTFQPPGH